MKRVLGLILELNPLHNGHTYFIEKAQELVNPDITIAVITTNFGMRGDIHTIDKFTKTKLLLKQKVDIVLELPFLGGVCSADYFAHNAVKTLSDFNITDLAFGAESDSIDEIYTLKNLLKNEEYDIVVKENLKKGYSYSTSTVKAIQTITDDLSLIEKFSLPNNTLAIQYLNALDKLNKNINVTLIKRIENNYYDECISSSIASATSLRQLLLNDENIDNFIPYKQNEINFINLKDAESNLYNLLQYQLHSNNLIDLNNILGVNEGIENRLINFSKEKDFPSFVNSVETKRYTKSYIKRLILNIVLKVPKEFSPQFFSYLRVLGMNEKGKKYISRLDKDTKNMIITSFKNQSNLNVQYELLATKIYGIITNQKDLYLNEYKIPIIGE